MAHRKAASVLPDPVGAEISACRPDAIASQAPVCAAVGAANAEANQDRVAVENRASTGWSVATTTEEHGRPAQASPHGGTRDRGTIYTAITDLQRVAVRFGPCFRAFSPCAAWHNGCFPYRSPSRHARRNAAWIDEVKADGSAISYCT